MGLRDHRVDFVQLCALFLWMKGRHPLKPRVGTVAGFLWGGSVCFEDAPGRESGIQGPGRNSSLGDGL